MATKCKAVSLGESATAQLTDESYDGNTGAPCFASTAFIMHSCLHLPLSHLLGGETGKDWHHAGHNSDCTAFCVAIVRGLKC